MSHVNDNNLDQRKNMGDDIMEGLCWFTLGEYERMEPHKRKALADLLNDWARWSALTEKAVNEGKLDLPKAPDFNDPFAEPQIEWEGEYCDLF